MGHSKAHSTAAEVKPAPIRTLTSKGGPVNRDGLKEAIRPDAQSCVRRQSAPSEPRDLVAEWVGVPRSDTSLRITDRETLDKIAPHVEGTRCGALSPTQHSCGSAGLLQRAAAEAIRRPGHGTSGRGLHGCRGDTLGIPDKHPGAGCCYCMAVRCRGRARRHFLRVRLSRHAVLCPHAGRESQESALRLHVLCSTRREFFCIPDCRDRGTSLSGIGAGARRSVYVSRMRVVLPKACDS